MNRTGLGLAIGAGYLLGRTKKLKMALAVGGLVAGKKLNLSPRAVADLVSQQLRDNPQFKELGDQLRGELQGVGKAASGALVERQISSLADRLHDRTAEVRGRLDGGGEDRDGTDEHADEEPDDRGPDDAGDDRDDGGRERGPDAARTAKKAAKKAPAKKGPAAKKAAPAKRAAGGPAKKTAAKKTAAKKTASASRGARSRPSKGGGE
ncbi:DNA primase [Streptomyces griseoincarnatus]|uniref:DNA primase n=1 Tax=Streptomyces sp. BSE7-9 TaxID=2759948 RepID=UPI000D60D7A6|nr:DNA primase [Streptomyces sp. BSE7-9]MBJ6642836.1 DNA primase [Streptomyces sp. BSE7-9]PWE10207.1 DNA primase [Streptomyces sp. BSE7F]